MQLVFTNDLIDLNSWANDMEPKIYSGCRRTTKRRRDNETNSFFKYSLGFSAAVAHFMIVTK